MKANRRWRPLLLLAAAALATLVASCSPRIIPASAPPPSRQRPLPPPQRPLPPPPSRPSPPAPQAPSQPLTSDWRQAPITPGDWTWSMEGGQSTARFAGGMLTLRCDRVGTVTLLRTGAAAGPVPMTITTSSGTRTLSAAPLPGATPALAVSLGARDPVLDAMIFSRGRFMVEAPGLALLHVPSWPEIGRVVEDCR